MKTSSNLTDEFEYELLDETQQVADLRGKLADLYPTPFADIFWWELRDPSLKSNGCHKLYYYEQKVLKHIILFEYAAKTPKKITIINKVFHISPENIENICRILFSEFHKSQQIVFEDIYEPEFKTMPKTVFEKTSNDVIIFDLPPSMDAYMKSLGSSTRKKINLMTNRIARDFPGFQVHFFQKNEILLNQIEHIVSFNRSRMKTKGITSALDDTECRALHRYASASGFGFLCVCTIDDHIIGGTINTVIGERAYMHVIAHDKSYNRYSVGQIALIHATKYLMEEKNIKYYHLLFGAQEYKFRHGGADRDLYTLRIFKNGGFRYFLGKIGKTYRGNFKKMKQHIKKNRMFIKWNKFVMKSS